jgi:hypothetical protein
MLFVLRYVMYHAFVGSMSDGIGSMNVSRYVRHLALVHAGDRMRSAVKGTTRDEQQYCRRS